MEIIWNSLGITGAFIWFAVLLMPWRPWSTRESLDAVLPSDQEELIEITALIPARDEEETISTTIRGLKEQGTDINIILVDDQSTDGTVKAAQRAGEGKIRIISGKPLPAGWSGKLWALEQGLRFVKTPLTLLLDADIEMKPSILVALRNMMKQNELQFASLMAELRMKNFWERVLMPAFIYFFKLLYPFRLSNSGYSRVAAGAGGCILLETRLLDEMGGFRALREELIDDCALARKVKSMGHKTWIGLTHSVKSIRRYNNLGTIWNMVTRTAFTQLKYSKILLILCTAILLCAFWLPMMVLIFGTTISRYCASIALCAMILSYMPTLRFYHMSILWAFTMPLAGMIYLSMTWGSAIGYWRGKRSQWKGRIYHGSTSRNP
ncbi:MAG: glycosyltransferase [Thermodesulfobacteriota bacterium]|nr:glycosyltransferase [Thermodesulfobacteriota bacterium]